MGPNVVFGLVRVASAFLPFLEDPNGQPYYPVEPARSFDDPGAFERYDVDTLFFIFYYQQGTYQQYLAAKELKKLLHSLEFSLVFNPKSWQVKRPPVTYVLAATRLDIDLDINALTVQPVLRCSKALMAIPHQAPHVVPAP